VGLAQRLHSVTARFQPDSLLATIPALTLNPEFTPKKTWTLDLTALPSSCRYRAPNQPCKPRPLHVTDARCLRNPAVGWVASSMMGGRLALKKGPTSGPGCPRRSRTHGDRESGEGRTVTRAIRSQAVRAMNAATRPTDRSASAARWPRAPPPHGELEGKPTRPRRWMGVRGIRILLGIRIKIWMRMMAGLHQPVAPIPFEARG